MFDYAMDVVIGIIFTICFTLLGTIIVLNCRELYYHDIDILGLEQTVNMDKEDIKDNYNILIDYILPFSEEKELVFPDFVSSEGGLKHFKEVKDIFKNVYVLACVFFVICGLIIFYKYKIRDLKYLFLSSITTMSIPIVLCLFLLFDFDKMFTIFHKLFFKNNLWQFDPYSDPVINILPSEYFLHCGIAIILFIIVCGLCLFTIQMGITKQYQKNEASK